jgi:hypothetical protein
MASSTLAGARGSGIHSQRGRPAHSFDLSGAARLLVAEADAEHARAILATEHEE